MLTWLFGNHLVAGTCPLSEAIMGESRVLEGVVDNKKDERGGDAYDPRHEHSGPVTLYIV